MAILEVEDIHTYYGDTYVLQGLSLELEQGQILGLLGRNGVGKTTLVSSIVGFVPPRRGRIVFKGADITRVSSVATIRAGMGLVPPGPIVIQGVWEAIAKLKREGLSILLVEQNSALALKLVDYVHVMSKGRVVYSGGPRDLWANEQVKSSYLGI